MIPQFNRVHWGKHWLLTGASVRHSKVGTEQTVLGKGFKFVLVNQEDHNNNPSSRSQLVDSQFTGLFFSPPDKRIQTGDQRFVLI